MTDPHHHEEARLGAILAFVDGHVRFAETKNAALIALTGGALAVLVQVLQGGLVPDGVWRMYTVALVGCFLCAGITSLLSFLPVRHIPWVRQRHEHDLTCSLLFFGEAQRHNAKSYVRALLEACGSEDRAASRMEVMYAEQIIVNSKIAARKFSYFTVAVWIVLAGLLTPVVALTLYLATSERHL